MSSPPPKNFKTELSVEPQPTELAFDLSHYLDCVLKYVEEEIMGEAYFYGLANYFEEEHACGKLNMLAQVERRAAEAMRPVLERYKLTLRDDSELQSHAKIWIQQRRHLTWLALMIDMSVRYPVYVEEFKQLEKNAPPDDLQALAKLTEHEIVLVEFANREISGHPDSLEPVRRYLE